MSRLMKDEPKFATAYTRVGTHFYAPEGSRMANDYEMQIDKKGHKILKCVGQHDIYPEIQSYAEECKIENIIARAAAGDMNALNARKAFYADITDTPRDLADAQNQILKLKNGFEKLPTEIKEKFDNSMERFVMTFGTEEWTKNMGFSEKKAPEAPIIDFIPGTTEEAKEVLTPEGGNN